MAIGCYPVNIDSKHDITEAELDLINWLSRQALINTDIAILLQGFCERLVGLGVPVVRGHLSTATLDPRLRGFSLTWHRDSGISRQETFLHVQEQPQRWYQSPMYYLLQSGLAELHCRLLPKTEPDFSVFDEFRAAGLTDYYAALFGFGWLTDTRHTQDIRELGIICTWATDAPDGFANPLKRLKRLLPTFALAVKSTMLIQITQTVFAAYLGSDAAARVLRGEVRRGLAQRIHAAICFADLRGFTRLADTMPSDRLMAMLNRYLECIVNPVQEQGGEVLKFLGDGLLATFELTNHSAADRCEAAVKAAVEALLRVKALNREHQAAGDPVMALDIALNLGEVSYGNVGSANRLDFTVIGPAVNETARMEALCESLNINLIVSQTFREGLGSSEHRLVHLGQHRLRGLREPKSLYTIAEVPAP